MARPSFVKQRIGGLTLREFIIRGLVAMSYRELAEDEDFRAKTGIKSLGNLTKWTKQFEIKLPEVYKYGIDNNIIFSEITYRDWLKETNRLSALRERTITTKKKRKTLSEYDALVKIGKEIGFEVSCLEDREILEDILPDLDERLHKLVFVGEEKDTRSKRTKQ